LATRARLKTGIVCFDATLAHRKFAQKKRKYPQKTNSKTVTNPTDNVEGMNPSSIFSAKEQFFANERKSTARAK
jgi:hypothetical protein